MADMIAWGIMQSLVHIPCSAALSPWSYTLFLYRYNTFLQFQCFLSDERGVLDQKPFRESPCLLTCLSSLSAFPQSSLWALKIYPESWLMPTVLNFANMYFHIKGYLFVILTGLTLLYLVAILKPTVRITNWLRSSTIDCYKHNNLNQLTACFRTCRSLPMLNAIIYLPTFNLAEKPGRKQSHNGVYGIQGMHQLPPCLWHNYKMFYLRLPC